MPACLTPRTLTHPGHVGADLVTSCRPRPTHTGTQVSAGSPVSETLRRPRRVIATFRKPRAPRRVFPSKESVMSKRELIDTGTDKRYVRRAEGGTFSESD